MNDEVTVVPDEDIVLVEPTAIALMEGAAIDKQISTAHAYPRVISAVREEVLTLATVDQSTAVAMHYAKPAGKKKIVGPSVRLAEIIVASYGNLRVKSYVVEEKLKSVTVRGECWDLQKNTGCCIEVTRSLMDKYGKRYPDHLVVTTTQAAIAIAFRNAVYKTVPMSLFNEQIKQIKQVAIGEGKTLQEQAIACVGAFKDFKIDKDEFCQIANLRKIDDISVDEIIAMRSIYTSLKEGTITKSELLKKGSKKSDLGDAEMEEEKTEEKTEEEI